ncbi:MAG: sulfatase-like hydrolase/transferase [Deltaproteobacteria bacterium]|nr:sulfatase-like hydrolase/transferase [Deltaproteobacteria bacterium]
MNQLKKIKLVFQEVLRLFLIFVLVFQIFRIAIYYSYRDLFNNLDFLKLTESLFLGLRFDLSSTSILLFIPIVILIFPLRITGHLFFRRFVVSVIYLELVAMIIFLTSDYMYFSFVKRHITNELLFLLNDSEYLMTEVSVKLLPIIFLLVLTILFYPLFLKATCPKKPEVQRSILSFVLILLVLIVVGRGGFQRKPIAVIDAYQYGSASQGHLILNGIFTASHFSISSKFIERTAGEEKLYLDTLNLPVSTNPDYPLERTNVQSGMSPKKNLVMIMIESLSFKYIDYLSGQNYGVTPNIDRIASNGLVFENFFANGQRSVDGAQSILTGIPPLPGMPDITALSVNYSSLGQLASDNHYRPIFLTTTLRESFSLDLIAGAAGFDDYHGLEDYPLLLNYIDAADRPLGWDYEAFMYLLKQLEGEKSNYVAFVNASSDHTPFARMQEPFNKYEHGTDTEGGYLNMLHYTDWALGEFINEYKKRKDFEETIFIITADHALPHFQGVEPYGKFRIPLIIYSPKNISPGRSKMFASQIDLFPTIIKLLDLEGKYSAIGKNILDTEKSFAVVKDGALLGIFSKEGFLVHNLKSVLEFQPADALSDEFTKTKFASKAVAFDHLTYLLLTQNRWLSP